MKQRLRMAAASLIAIALAGCGRTPDTNPPADSAGNSKNVPRPSHAIYSLEWASNDVPTEISRESPVPIHVSVKNTGDWAWNDPKTANPGKPDGTYAVRLSYRWVGPTGRAEPQSSVRGELAKPVGPGETANFTLAVVPPKEPGNYKLELDLVEELVSFFSEKGTQKLSVAVTVK